nr:hypothetical protein [Eubacterium sp.]
MIFWYEELYMDSYVVKNEKKCKKIIEERCCYKKDLKKKWKENLAPWNTNYELLVLANNKNNLFEIINTKQMFFSYYSMSDIYVVGVAKHYEGAVEILRQIMESGYRKDDHYDPRVQFTKEHFSRR